MNILLKSWYYRHWWNYLLLPFACIFYIISVFRRCFYSIGIFKQYKIALPVIVVGNITVGGTGKTPLVIYLVEQLKQHGFRPAVISRGYGRRNRHLQFVTADSSVRLVGDEPLVIAQRTQCPVVVCPNRVEAARAVMEKTDANIIISDDGLQHYALARDIEIVVIDGMRRLGNGMLLPAGPLREPASRMSSIDFIINNGDDRKNEIEMNLIVDQCFHLPTRQAVALTDFVGKTVHAVAGIGNPKRFFNTLIAAGIKIIPHDFSDHHFFTEQELNFGDDLLIFMTEKDAVKCTTFFNPKMYCVTVNAHLPDCFMPQLLAKLKG